MCVNVLNCVFQVCWCKFLRLSWILIKATYFSICILWVCDHKSRAQQILLYQIGLKLSVGTVLTSKQIRWSPNFSRTIDSDAILKWGGKGLVLPHCIEIWEHPPSLPHYLFHPLSVIVILVISCTISKILQVIVLMTRPLFQPTLGCSCCTSSPMLGSIWAGTFKLFIRELFSKYSNLCEKHTWTSQTNRQMDRRTDTDSDLLWHNRALRSIAR